MKYISNLFEGTCTCTLEAIDLWQYVKSGLFHKHFSKNDHNLIVFTVYVFYFETHINYLESIKNGMLTYDFAFMQESENN